MSAQAGHAEEVSAQNSSGPLDGVRVVDLTQALAGPFCTMLLADLGADVIKVEPPRGDMTRYAGPLLPDDELKAYGGYFQSINRNKRSICVDLKSPHGVEVVRELVRTSPVLVENMRPGVMDRLGLSYEALRDLNPALVYACVRGFGDPRTGVSPYTEWPAFDVTAQAMGGFIGITGAADGTVQKAGASVGDIYPGTLLALGICAALHHATTTGRGQFLDVSMYDAILALCERIVYQHSYLGEVPGPQGNSHPMLCPFDVFEASDGHVTIAAPTDNHWALLCDAVGRPDLATDDRYSSNLRRVKHGDDVRKIIAGWTIGRTKAEIVEVLGGKVPVAPVNTIADIYADRHTAARGMLVEVEQPGSANPVTIVGPPIKLTETPSAIRRRAPLLGEHTDEVLSDVGMSDDEIAGLRKAEVIT